MAHAEAYKDPGTPEEQSRRTFMANAVYALGGVIGLGIAIPVITSLLPPSDATSDAWSGLTPEQAAAFKKATDQPVKVTFAIHETNGYFGASDTEQFVWAVKASDDELHKERPELFSVEKVPYPVLNMGFVIFSPICPHLGCRYAWNQAQNKFICPCHGSVYSKLGRHEAGPALRGLDPLPLRDFQGKVQITWIEYATNTPALIVQKIG
ncbi:MAG TPA: ubiquinol-cytochrome c reductase iron-sulfur subunit [Candidatus Acidoferrum sp.]|nr:ubiquinol-cytochrome c reductase iron-sulfur subunit [Candidatus Acidoferrum sp.]